MPRGRKSLNPPMPYLYILVDFALEEGIFGKASCNCVRGLRRTPTQIEWWQTEAPPGRFRNRCICGIVGRLPYDAGGRTLPERLPFSADCLGWRTGRWSVSSETPSLHSSYAAAWVFRFLPSSFFRTRMPLSTCFSSSRNGGRKRRTVSCVLLKSTPSARACSTIGRAGTSSCKP